VTGGWQSALAPGGASAEGDPRLFWPWCAAGADLAAGAPRAGRRAAASRPAQVPRRAHLVIGAATIGTVLVITA